MKHLRNNTQAGFVSLVECLIILALMGAITAMAISRISYTSIDASTVSTKLMADFEEIEFALLSYKNDKSSYPPNNVTTGTADGNANFLDETVFVPIYIFPPKAPSGFTTTYGVNGYLVNNGANGDYICAKVTVKNVSDPLYVAMVTAQKKLASGKLNIDTSCPSTSNITAGAGSVTLYTTYWISRTS